MFKEILIELIENCNLKCKICMTGWRDCPNRIMTFDNAKFIISKIAPYTKMIRLNGRGESTLHPDLINIIDYISLEYPDMKISLGTNLMDISPELINRILLHNIQLYVSLDSLKDDLLRELRGGADLKTITDNLVLLKDLHPRPYIVFTIQPENISEIIDIAKFCFSNDLYLIYNYAKCDDDRNKILHDLIDNFKEFVKVQFSNSFLLMKCNSDKDIKIPNKIFDIELNTIGAIKRYSDYFYCPAVYENLFITWDGKVCPCNMMNPYEYGDIYKNTMDEIFDSRNEFAKIKYPKNKYCINCSNMGI